MTEKYVGTNQWKYCYFKSPIGVVKLLLYVFIKPNYISIAEYNLALNSTEEQIDAYVKSEIERIETAK